MAIEIRSGARGRRRPARLLAPLNHDGHGAAPSRPSARCRSIFGGSCQIPLAAFATVAGRPDAPARDGRHARRHAQASAEVSGPAEQPEYAGRAGGRAAGPAGCERHPGRVPSRCRGKPGCLMRPASSSITRPRAQAERWRRRSPRCGRTAVLLPLLEITPLADDAAPLRAALARPATGLRWWPSSRPTPSTPPLRTSIAWPAAVPLAVVGEGSRAGPGARTA